MDRNEKDNCGSEKTEDHLNHKSSSMSSDWQQQLSNPFSSAQVGSTALHPMSMVNSFDQSLWNPPANASALALNGSSIPTCRESAPGGWYPSGPPPSAGASFRRASLGILPPGLPADSAFIERAARFSMFNAGNVSRMTSPFSASQFLGHCSTSSKSFVRAEAEKSGPGPVEARSAPEDGDHRTKDADLGVSSKNPMESKFYGAAAQQDAAQLIIEAGDSPSKDLGTKRRKRTNEDLQSSAAQGAPQVSIETKKGNAEADQNAEPNSSTMATVKPNGKDVKEDSGAPKPDYIHIRARRGQATNSHSLAERLRREKISERMKLLQDLVPGCSKVTGKAVMLDEIINYVQSLQRQVEFLSMKLATVSPSLDFNIEALLSKEIFQNNYDPSSAIDFVPDIVRSQLHMPQQGLIPSGLSGALNPSDSLGRAINAQLAAMNGYKEPVHNMWSEEIQNALQMNYSGNPDLHMQEFNKPCD